MNTNFVLWKQQTKVPKLGSFCLRTSPMQYWSGKNQAYLFWYSCWSFLSRREQRWCTVTNTASSLCSFKISVACWKKFLCMSGEPFWKFWTQLFLLSIRHVIATMLSYLSNHLSGKKLECWFGWKSFGISFHCCSFHLNPKLFFLRVQKYCLEFGSFWCHGAKYFLTLKLGELRMNEIIRYTQQNY